jgi:hypothetical protein
MSTPALSRRARFHQRFLVEERVMAPQSRRGLDRAGFGLIGVGVVLFPAFTAQVASGTGLTVLDPVVAEWFREKRFAEGTLVEVTELTEMSGGY